MSVPPLLKGTTTLVLGFLLMNVSPKSIRRVRNQRNRYFDPFMTFFDFVILCWFSKGLPIVENMMISLLCLFEPMNVALKLTGGTYYVFMVYVFCYALPFFFVYKDQDLWKEFHQAPLPFICDRMHITTPQWSQVGVKRLHSIYDVIHDKLMTVDTCTLIVAIVLIWRYI
jgi:hypothetical protein